MSTILAAKLIINGWSSKARRAALAKRKSKGLKPGFKNQLASGAKASAKKHSKKLAHDEAAVPAKKAAKLRKEYGQEIQSLLDSYKELRKKFEARLKPQRKGKKS